MVQNHNVSITIDTSRKHVTSNKLVTCSEQ